MNMHTPEPSGSDAVASPDLERLALELAGRTPLSLILRGYSAAGQVFAINHVVAQHLHAAALAEARAVLSFGHAGGTDLD